MCDIKWQALYNFDAHFIAKAMLFWWISRIFWLEYLLHLCMSKMLKDCTNEKHLLYLLLAIGFFFLSTKTKNSHSIYVRRNSKCLISNILTGIFVKSTGSIKIRLFSKSFYYMYCFFSKLRLWNTIVLYL